MLNKCKVIVGFPRIFLVFLMLSVTLGAFPHIVRAANFNIGDTVEVTTNLNVRTGPGTSYSEITDPDYPGYAPQGTKGKVLDGPTNADGYTWWKVDFGPGLYSGWSVEGGLTKVSEPPPPSHISPSNGATEVSLTPMLQWSVVSSADRYGLYVSKPPYGPANLVYENENLTGTSLSLPSGRLSQGVTYYWNMRAHNSAGWGSFSSSWSFTTLTTPPPNQAPTCSISANPRSGNTPLDVTFTMSANDPDGSIDAWVLDVNGDGNADYYGNGNPPSIQHHTYTSAGSYSVVLMVSDNEGDNAHDTETINVGSVNIPPTCSLSASQNSGSAPLSVTFTISASDSDGSITAWVLDADGDGITDFSGDGTPPSTRSYTYTSQGNYTAVLMVSDNDDATASDTETINVGSANQPPTCSVSANPRSGIAPLTVTFSISANDPDGAISAWVLDVDGDGNADYSGSGSPPSTKSHTYTNVGTYSVALMVSDNNGANASDTETVNVGSANQPPTCSLSATPRSGNAPLTVTFSLSASDPDGSISAWALDVDGNGSTDYSGSGNPPSTQAYTYTNAGSYTAVLMVSDNKDATASDTETINVSPSVSKPDLLVVGITWSPASPSIGETVTFTVTVKNQGSAKAGSSKAYYFIDNVQQGYDYVSSIDPGATTTVTFTWKAQDGTHAVRAVADYEGTVDEGDETNNGKTVTYSATALSDLIIESIIWLPDSPSIGETVTFTITIKNQGVGKAGSCKVYYFFDDVQQGYDSVYSLDPNATLTETFTWNAEEGSHTVKVAADYNDEVTEGDETNNEKMVTVVPPSVLARIDSHYPAAPLEVQVGEPVTLGVTFTNIGNKAWTFYAAASLRRPDGTEEHLQLKTVSLTSGEQDSATWNYTVDKEGGWDVVFGIWKEQEQINSLGHTGWMSNYIVVSAENKPPVARLNLDYAYVESGTPVSFDASGSYDQEGAELIYEWDFGDGTVRVGREFKSIEHRFRGSMVSADSLEIQTKSYTVTLTVRDDKGATTSDSATIEVKPLQKSLKIIPPPRPVPTGAFARMTAYYNWVGVAEDTGEDIYVVSTIHFEAQGFISYVLSVWDEYSSSIGVPAWSKGLVYFGQPVEKTYAYPFESSRDWTHTFGDEYFEGMAVGSSDKMRLWAFSIEEISGVLGPTWDGVSVSFGLETESEPLTAEEAPDTFVAHLGSSAEMRVYDLQRQVTGVIDGKIRTDIPHSGFCDDTVVILWPTGSYACEVVGTTEGTYDLAMVTVGKKTSTFAHTDVTTSAGAVHQYDIDWGAVVEGEKDVTMRIDSDGDGKFETVKHLTAQEESPWVWIVVAGVSGLLGVLVGAFMVRRRMSKKQST